MINHQQLRHSLRKQCAEQTEISQEEAAHKLLALFKMHPVFLNATHMAAYDAIRGELSPKPLLQLAWDLGKMCYLPRISHQHQGMLEFVEYQPQDVLTYHQLGMGEPYTEGRRMISAEQLDLVLTPLVAFDTQGHRLGTGGGYYDRTFAFLSQQPRPNNPYLCGIAYEFQCQPNLTPESWDITLDGIITEKQFYKI